MRVIGSGACTVAGAISALFSLENLPAEMWKSKAVGVLGSLRKTLVCFHAQAYPPDVQFCSSQPSCTPLLPVQWKCGKARPWEFLYNYIQFYAEIQVGALELLKHLEARIWL